MRERSRNNVVRRAGALALVWVLVAVASWAIASGGGGEKSGHSQPRPVVTASQASLQMPALNAKLPAMRVKRRQRAHATTRRKARNTGGGANMRDVAVQVPDTTTSSQSPVSSGTSSSGSSSSSAGSTSSGNVPPTGGAPPP